LAEHHKHFYFMHPVSVLRTNLAICYIDYV